MTYDSFVRDRLPLRKLLPEFRFDLPDLQYPERLNAAAELLKGGTPDSLASSTSRADGFIPSSTISVDELPGFWSMKKG